MAARKKQTKTKEIIVKKEFPLTAQDQITYIYKKEGEEYTEVTNVSYEIKIKNTWITIIRFDSSHGYLHQHIRISLEDADELSTGTEVKTGNHHEWLTTAIADITSKYLDYRKEFFERSHIDEDSLF